MKKISLVIIVCAVLLSLWSANAALYPLCWAICGPGGGECNNDDLPATSCTAWLTEGGCNVKCGDTSTFFPGEGMMAFSSAM